MTKVKCQHCGKPFKAGPGYASHLKWHKNHDLPKIAPQAQLNAIRQAGSNFQSSVSLIQSHIISMAQQQHGMPTVHQLALMRISDELQRAMKTYIDVLEDNSQ